MNDKQKEALLILQEECAEVIQAACKISRFGAESRWPTEESGTTLEEFQMEIGQTLAMIDILTDQGVLNTEAVNMAREHKKIKLKTWSNIFN